MKLFDKALIQKWQAADKANDSLIAETAFAAIFKRPQITTRAFADALRECGIRGNTTLLNYALAQAKVDGANQAGVTAQVATKRAEIAKKQLKTQREAAEKKAREAKKLAELKELKEKALTDKELAAELVERNLTGEKENLKRLESEVVCLTLLMNKSRRTLENANVSIEESPIDWTERGVQLIVECSDGLVPLACCEVESWINNAVAEKREPEVIENLKGCLEALEIRKGTLGILNK